jgi:O-antigen/teichoic acid export membrane protein
LSAPRRGSVDLVQLGGEAALVVGAGAVGNILSYLFHFFVSRRLGPEAYGTLVTLMSVANILAVLGGSLGTVAMQESARMWASHEESSIAPFVRQAGRPVFVIAIVVALALLAASLALGPYLHVTQWALWLALATNVAIAIAMAFARGAAQGAHRFGAFAGSLAGEGAMKVAAGYGLVIMGFGVLGALGGLVASVIVGLFVALIPLAGVRGGAAAAKPVGQALDHLRLGGAAISVLGITTASTALLFIDMLFAKHHFSGADAGYFGAAGTLARTLPFGITLIALIVMPKAAAAAYAGRDALARVLMLTAAASVGAIAAGAAILIFFGSQIMTLTYGTAFAPAAGILRLYTLDEALLGLWLAATSYLIALAQYRVFPWLLAAVALEAILFALFGRAPAQLLSIAIATNAALVPIVWWLAYGALREVAQAHV